MRPLILHNVPDDELYTGEDGVQRPYAMIFPEGDRQPSISRARRPFAETGSFGKSTRRTRSRTGSAPPKREDATMKHADEVFSNYMKTQERHPKTAGDRNSGYGQADVESSSNPPATQPSRLVKEPTEVILRGYASPSQQYAAINHYEQLAGRICEDYPREPPFEARRYKSELRDPAFTRSQNLTAPERAKVSRIANGEHWVKITFESADAADAATYASPQKILGHLVYAEPFMNRPPAEDCPVLDKDVASMDPLLNYALGGGRRLNSTRSSSRPRSWHVAGDNNNNPSSPPESQVSSVATLDTTTASTATVMGNGDNMMIDSNDPFASTTSASLPVATSAVDEAYCRRVPTARRVTLKAPEEALAPQSTRLERLLANVPLVGWFSGSIIGNQVPRTDNGDFDLARASLYWRIMYYLDYWFGLFGYELVTGDKED